MFAASSSKSIFEALVTAPIWKQNHIGGAEKAPRKALFQYKKYAEFKIDLSKVIAFLFLSLHNKNNFVMQKKSFMDIIFT